MNPEVSPWVVKAEEDFAVARRELRVRRNPAYDSICFHAEQCVEKYLKARLVAAGLAFPKTHDLVLLVDLLAKAEPLWAAFRPDMSILAGFAALFRYPGESADRETAKDAVTRCRRFRKAARLALGLSGR